MLLDNTGLIGVRSDLGHLDESSEKLGFVRWQWEYRRATYDLKLQDRSKGEDYFLRITTRAVEGKLENPDAILEIEHVYIGRATFPHGLDYESAIPAPILNVATQRVQDLKKLLSK
ncbi:YugN family protein [Cohnella yongneupensis]|uniref:YugN family protein n=1 Tax=Cohnella yongneupensis TaxID=425006 RepID=A0ABW0R5T5_9BACL